MANRVRLGFCFLVWMVCGTVGWSEPNSPGLWIVVTAPGHFSDIESLSRLRQQQRFQVVIADSNQLYVMQDSLEQRATKVHEFLQEQYDAHQGTIHVVLAGAIARDLSAESMSTHLPSFLGRHGRMEGKPSDALYGFLDDEHLSRVTVGRLPARTREEMRGIVEKILRYEQNGTPGPWNYRLSVLAGNPGGSTPMQRPLAEQVVQAVGRERLARVHPNWMIQGMIHAKGSPFYVSDAELHSQSRALLEGGQAFSFYLGHSGPSGVSSEGVDILTRNDFGQLTIRGRQGVFFSCGCYATALKGDSFWGWKMAHDGYAWAAMRNPHGPVAVMGGATVSNAIFGQVGFDQMIDCLSREDSPQRLSQYWQAVQEGITRKPINPFLFMMYDNADGSGGRVPLAEQRQEHLEMWSLLGDPAMMIPTPSKEIEIADISPVTLGQDLCITGTVNPLWDGGTARMGIERRFEDVFVVSDPRRESQSVCLWANEVVVLGESRVEVQGGRFATTFNIPGDFPFSDVVLRVSIDKGEKRAMVTKRLMVESPSVEGDIEEQENL